MEAVHVTAPAAARRMWSYLRAVFLMVRKGVLSNKRKLLVGMHLLVKRRNYKAVANLLSHHHHPHHYGYGGGNALRRRDYEFSCSNSPNPAPGGRRRLVYFPCLGALAEEMEEDNFASAASLPAPPPLARIDYCYYSSPAPSSSPGLLTPGEDLLLCAASPTPGEDAFSVRVSNYSSEENQGGSEAVDDDAEEFIRRFYDQLRRQNQVAMLPSQFA